jgi:hypothetical protein
MLLVGKDPATWLFKDQNSWGSIEHLYRPIKENPHQLYRELVCIVTYTLEENVVIWEGTDCFDWKQIFPLESNNATKKIQQENQS